MITQGRKPLALISMPEKFNTYFDGQLEPRLEGNFKILLLFLCISPEVSNLSMAQQYYQMKTITKVLEFPSKSQKSLKAVNRVKNYCINDYQQASIHPSPQLAFAALKLNDNNSKLQKSNNRIEKGGKLMERKIKQCNSLKNLQEKPNGTAFCQNEKKKEEPHGKKTDKLSKKNEEYYRSTTKLDKFVMKIDPKLLKQNIRNTCPDVLSAYEISHKKNFSNFTHSKRNTHSNAVSQSKGSSPSSPRAKLTSRQSNKPLKNESAPKKMKFLPKTKNLFSTEANIHKKVVSFKKMLQQTSANITLPQTPNIKQNPLVKIQIPVNVSVHPTFQTQEESTQIWDCLKSQQYNLQNTVPTLENTPIQPSTGAHRTRFCKQVSSKPSVSGEFKLRDFNIVKMIGEGKFGEVFMAVHKETGFIVALKKILKQVIMKNGMIKQLEDEVKIHLSLNHPNIVNFYGCFDDKDSVYYILEFMTGQTLFDYLNDREKLTLQKVKLFLRDIISGVAYMHEKSIVHRDLKPENILLTIEGNMAKICDMGWSATTSTPRRTYCGTFDYVAPEILERKKYDSSVDAWCIGALTYELLFGKMPYEGDRATIISNKINDVRLSFPEDFPAEAKDFILSLLRKNPEERPKCKDLLNHKFLSIGSQAPVQN